MVRAAAAFIVYGFKLRKRLRRLRPDVIHSNGVKMHLAAAIASPRRTSLVWHLHDYPRGRKITSHLLPRLSSQVRLVLANSRSVAADARTLLPSKRIEVLENSVDVTRFQPMGPALDLDCLSGWDETVPEALRIGLVGTFARWKGQDLFLQAIARLPKNLPVRFYVIGGPVYSTAGSQWTKEELQKAAAPMANQVGFTGWIDDIPSALRALDIVVHASIKPEPFGLVIIQARACGKAVIVSDEGGAAEVVAGDAGAVMFQPRDPQSLADAMLFLIGSPERRLAAGVSGPMAVRERFGKDRMIALASGYLGSVVSHGS